MYNGDMAIEMCYIPEIEPWTKYPDLTQSRLIALSNELRRVRSECVTLFSPADGDGDWSLGCRVYERTFFAIKALSKTVNWLDICSELRALQFSFCVGSVPLRFYKGDPDDPPSRYLAHTPGEEQHIQTCFEFAGLPPVDTVLRLAVEVDAARQASSIVFVEIDSHKDVIGKYRIPHTRQVAQIMPMQAPPVNLAPIVAEPIKKENSGKTIKEFINAAKK